MSSLQKKIKSRDTAVNTIEKAFEKVDKTIQEDIIATIDVIEKKFKKISTTNSEIEELAEETENSETICDECLQSEINITKKINILKALVKKDDREQEKNKETKNESSRRKFINLPKLTIEKFSGDYTKFNTFIDSFVAAVDSCEELRDIEKFNYLKSYLEGEALRTIKGITLTNKNYKEALDVLRRRYGNKQRVISAHMNELLNLKKIERDRDLNGLRKLYDDIESHVRSLRSLDVDDDNYGSL